MRRHVPERTCVGCGVRSPKNELLRLVRAADGSIEVDLDARAPGRGVYVHRRHACVERALRPGAIARALRRGLGADEARKLRGLIEGMQGNA